MKRKETMDYILEYWASYTKEELYEMHQSIQNDI